MRNHVDSTQRYFQKLVLSAIATASMSIALLSSTLSTPNVFGGQQNVDHRCNYTMHAYENAGCLCPSPANQVPGDCCEFSRPIAADDPSVPCEYCEMFESETCTFTYVDENNVALDCGVVFLCNHNCDDILPPGFNRICNPTSTFKPNCPGPRPTCGIDPWSMQ